MKSIKLFALALVGLLFAACGQVDPGESATFVKWGTMYQECYGPGLYFYNPFSTNMDLINVQVQAFEAKDLSAATKDLQEVHATVVVNYMLDARQCHKMVTEVGHQYREKVLFPALQDALKAGTAHFEIGEIIRERGRLRSEVTKALQARVSPFYISVKDEGVNLTNFGLSKAYMAAVEAKQIAEQNVIQATRNAEAKREEAKGFADAAREQAKGEAAALQTKGTAQADYNAKVSASLTQSLVQMEAIKAWQAGGSQVPQISGAGGLLIQVPTPATKPQQ
jgi:regulator of protease activity HflC (stomatin/prohibitin superfamily)